MFPLKALKIGQGCYCLFVFISLYAHIFKILKKIYSFLSGKCMHGAMMNRQSCYWNPWYPEKASLFVRCPVRRWLWNVSIVITLNPAVVIWKCTQDAYMGAWVGDVRQAQPRFTFRFAFHVVWHRIIYILCLNSITNKLIENNKCIFAHAFSEPRHEFTAAIKICGLYIT